MKVLAIILGVLTGIIAGDYEAKTLTAEQQDSVLMGEGLPVTGQSSKYKLTKEGTEKIYRHSEIAAWYVTETEKGKKKLLGESFFKSQESGVRSQESVVSGQSSDTIKMRDAKMSPNGRYVAFAKDNNLYIHKCDYGTEVAVTKDEDKDMINGIADWLYEEEFGITALYAWSEDSKQLAFIKLDEHDVPSFSWNEFLGDGLRVTGYGYPQYPRTETLRYPKAGCENAKASVWVYDVATKALRRLPVTGDGLGGVYLPRIKWVNGNVMVLRVNRDQTKMEVVQCNAKSTVSQVIYTEESKENYIDYSLFDQWQWLSDGRFIALSEKDGWRSAYLYSNQGYELRRLTPEGIDVTAIYAVNERTQMLYYQAATTPATRHLYAVSIQKSAVSNQLTKEDGIWSARFSKDASRAVVCYQSFTTPHIYTLCKVEGLKLKVERVIKDNAKVKEAWEANKLPEPQLLRINDLEAMLLTPNPLTFNPSPLVLMHYSGPGSQRVLNRWRKKFEYALVEQGYAVLIVDPHGSDCKGRAWRNATYMSLGQKEAEDLIAAAKEVAKRPDIDGNRMAIIGWSYGGYETLYTMSTKGHPFKAGVAIAPVTDWRLYDTGYTERYMRRPQVNERGYEAASLMNKAADLTGKVLIIHGTGDDNVHVQHTMQYIDALVNADKQFEMQLYPDDDHHLKRGKNATHLHNRIILFLQQNL